MEETDVWIQHAWVQLFALVHPLQDIIHYCISAVLKIYYINILYYNPSIYATLTEKKKAKVFNRNAQNNILKAANKVVPILPKTFI